MDNICNFVLTVGCHHEVLQYLAGLAKHRQIVTCYSKEKNDTKNIVFTTGDMVYM